MALRGFAWFGVYLALVVTPAVAAAMADPFLAFRPALVEFAVALGFLAFAAVLAQFALVSRFGAASRPFGTDALVQFHQCIGFVALALVVAHPLLLNAHGLSWSSWNPAAGTPSLRTGALGLWAIVAIVLTTVLRRRLRLSYEWWQGLHLFFSVVAAAAMLAHLLLVSGYTRVPTVRWVVIAYVAGFGAVTVHCRLVRPLRLVRRPWVVTANDDIGAGTRLLRVRPVRHAGISLRTRSVCLARDRTHAAVVATAPVVNLLVGRTGRRPHRRVCRQGPRGLVVAGRPDAGTRLTRVGGGPFGAFTTERAAAQGFVMIAGGIGIAPMRSMLLTMRDRGDRRHVVLLYGARDKNGLVFTSELAELCGALNLEVVHVLEAPADTPGAERGHMTADLLRRHLPAQFRRYHYFVCGPPPMMDAAEAALRALGIPPHAIDSERFNVV